MFLQLLYENKT